MLESLSFTVLQRFAQGDEHAFTAVFRRYSAPMLCVAQRVLGSRELAADAVQQAFIQAWRSAGSCSPDLDIAPWLFTITHRTAIDLWRKERRQPELSNSDSPIEFTIPGPSLESVWETWQVRLAIQELPPDEAQVLKMAYLQGLTQAETAQRLGIAVGTVKSRTHRAHHRMRGLLSHLMDPEGERGNRERP